jgi:hypothetical protein
MLQIFQNGLGRVELSPRTCELGGHEPSNAFSEAEERLFAIPPEFRRGYAIVRLTYSRFT